VSEPGGLAGKVVLVTGGSRGIGRATALAFAAAGAAVTLTYLGRAEQAREVVREIEASSGTAHAAQADITREADLARLAEEVQRRHGHLDVLVNNAGSVTAARTATLDLETWRRVLDVNLTGAFLVTRACLPLLGAAGGAAIVNVSSVAGVRGGTIGPHYAAAKGGLIALTRYWARELLPDRIRVNCVAPSMTDTDMAGAMWPGAERARMEGLAPMGRYAEPSEVAAAIVFLASPGASYITGECLNVTGGF
jgi:NAD(P)-dependent dehydrogenase (short-subunit alcohol dehydrogenase family)